MTEKLKIIKPIPITDAVLVSTNVPETDYAEWAAGTTYALGDRVIVSADHMVYESAAAANTGHAPAAEPTWWIVIAPTNPWRMFDTSISSQTAQAGLVSVTLRPGVNCNAFAVLNTTECSEIRIRAVDPVIGTLYDKTTTLDVVQNTADWWVWFFGTRVKKTQIIDFDLAHVKTADIIVDFIGGDDLAVGVLMVGTMIQFGLGTKYGAKVGIQDYSRKETNEYGDTMLVQRAFAKRAGIDMVLTAAEVDSFQNSLAEVRALPCLWIASSLYESLTIFGFYKQFDVLISYPDYSDCSLEIEGLT